MTPDTEGDHRPDSDELSRVLRRLADTTQTAYLLLDTAALCPQFPSARAPARLRAVAFLLTDLGDELGAIAARLEDTPPASVTDGGAA
ncbi:hypothetical protein ABZN20_18660 [Methylococcus sp. ANG]|uniref:hypothetical protein n=1 Tax=Methylococcus sp. ANG TaxID=3231903 RepID=UPI0034574B54